MLFACRNAETQRGATVDSSKTYCVNPPLRRRVKGTRSYCGLPLSPLPVSALGGMLFQSRAVSVPKGVPTRLPFESTTKAASVGRDGVVVQAARIVHSMRVMMVFTWFPLKEWLIK